MSKIEINKEFKEYLDQLCEEHIIKITKKNETEEAFNYIKEDLINKIIENLEEEQKITSFKKFPEYLFHMINLYIIICIKRVSDKRNYGLYALLLVHVIQLLLNLYIYYCCFP